MDKKIDIARDKEIKTQIEREREKDLTLRGPD